MSLSEWELERLDSVVNATDCGFRDLVAEVERILAVRLGVMGRDLQDRERFALDAANDAADAGKRTTYIRHSTEAYAYADAQLVVKKGGLVG